MKGKTLCCAVLLIYLAAFAADAAVGGIPADEWIRMKETLLGRGEKEISQRFGPPERSAADELLSVTVAAYPIGKNGEGMRLGEIFYEDGIAVALRTEFIGDGDRIMGRFVSAHLGEMLASGDLHAIAGADYDCDLYRVVEVNARGASVYLLRGAFYRRMSAIGDVPSLPARDGRGGHAA